MVKVCQHIAAAPAFQNFILGIILLAGVVVGMQTYKDFEAEHHDLLTLLDRIILGIFVLEVVIKIIAEGKTPWNYFKDPWNIFDFSIVAICLLPIQNSQFVAVLRLARVLRVLKLVSAVPRLQVLVNAVLTSTAHPVLASVFFVSFILTGAMIVLNLFVGVMLTGMDDARKETELAEAAKRKASEDTDIKQELIQMEKQLQEMSQKLSQNLLILSQKAEENSDKINKMLSKDDK